MDPRTTLFRLALLPAAVGLAVSNLAAQQLVRRYPYTATGGYQSFTTCNFDGDGTPDVAMVVWGTNSNMLRIFSGASLATQLFSTAIAYQDYAPGILFTDIDRDGRDDLILAEPGDESLGGTNRGRVRAWSNLPLWGSLPPTWTLSGTRDGELLGSSLAVAGDRDGDRVLDLAIGASGYCSEVGHVRVVSGATGLDLQTAIADTRTCTYFGSPSGGIGDVDGDGLDEILVGANEHSVPGSGRAVLFYSGGGNGPLTLTGTRVRDHFGTSVCGIGSVDGDSVPDFLVGADQHELPSLPGYVSAHRGGNGTTLWTVTGSGAGDYFGSTVVGLGDVNGDGTPDVAISAPQLLSTGPGGYVDVRSGSDGQLLVRIQDPMGTGYFGNRIALGGVVAGRTRLIIAGRDHVDVYELEPGAYRTFGTGCPGSGGIVPSLTSAAGLPPLPGLPFRLLASGVPATGLVALAIGWDDRFWGPFSLPMELTAAGMPGCFVLTSSDGLMSMQRTSSGAEITLPIPGVIGFGFYVQVLARDVNANPLGYVLSNGLRLRT
ncbi:MAG: VCBS repeat-containing protein [Planctomycetes bacterium]|nr:VCBS repeat-containing protein [Planctomycetota bacterium]